MHRIMWGNFRSVQYRMIFGLLSILFVSALSYADPCNLVKVSSELTSLIHYYESNDQAEIQNCNSLKAKTVMAEIYHLQKLREAYFQAWKNYIQYAFSIGFVLEEESSSMPPSILENPPTKTDDQTMIVFRDTTVNQPSAGIERKFDLNKRNQTHSDLIQKDDPGSDRLNEMNRRREFYLRARGNFTKAIGLQSEVTPQFHYFLHTEGLAEITSYIQFDTETYRYPVFVLRDGGFVISLNMNVFKNQPSSETSYSHIFIFDGSGNFKLAYAMSQSSPLFPTAIVKRKDLSVCENGKYFRKTPYGIELCERLTQRFPMPN